MKSSASELGLTDTPRMLRVESEKKQALPPSCKVFWKGVFKRKHIARPRQGSSPKGSTTSAVSKGGTLFPILYWSKRRLYGGTWTSQCTADRAAQD